MQRSTPKREKEASCGACAGQALEPQTSQGAHTGARTTLLEVTGGAAHAGTSVHGLRGGWEAIRSPTTWEQGAEMATCGELLSKKEQLGPPWPGTTRGD